MHVPDLINDTGRFRSHHHTASFSTMTQDLCLVCSSSLPPLRSSSSASDIFITNCCQRPICPSCITSNPRIARYDPCLACLVGVGVLTSTPGSLEVRAMTDEDTFILGDDDEDADDGAGFVAKAESQPETIDSIIVEQEHKFSYSRKRVPRTVWL